MTTLTVNLTEEQKIAIEEYAKEKNLSVSELFKKTLLEKMEDEEDLQIALKELKNKNNKTYSMEEVMEEFFV